MRFRYYLNPVTGQPHIYDHGVVESEAESVLINPAEDAQARDGARAAIGRTAGGRVLRVVYVLDDEPGGIFVLTAMPVGAKALKAFRRRMRRR